MRILVSGRSKLVRQGVAMLLGGGEHVVHQAADLSRAAARLRFRGADVLVLDVDPYDAGVDALRRLAAEEVETPVVALMTSPSRAHVAAVLAAGAAACVAKEAVADELLPAIERVAARPRMPEPRAALA